MTWAESMSERWVKDLYFESVESAVHDAVVELLQFFPKPDEYAAEKMIKSFVEHIACLEKYLLCQCNCNPSTAFKVEHDHSELERIRVSLKNIEKRILQEVHRLQRHYQIFLGSVQRKAT